MRSITFITVFTFSVLFQSVFAQQQIDLNEIFEKINTQNYSIQINEKEVAIANAEFNQTNAVLLPSIAISHTGISTNNPLMAFGSKLNQEIVTQSDFNPDLLNNPKTIENFATKIEIKQPLFNADGLFMRKAAKAKREAQSLQLNRTKEAIELEAVKAYMQLQLAYNAIEVLQKALEAANENYKLAKNSFAQGLIQKSDLLAVSVYKTDVENQLQTAKSNIQNASDFLHFLMGETSTVVLKPATKLIPDLTSTYTEEISNTRADLAALEKSIKAYNNMHKASKLRYLPNLNAFGSYELYDDSVFQGNANGYLVGAQLSWNIFEGYKRIGKIQESKASLEKAKLQLAQYTKKSELEFNKTKRAFKDAEQQLNLMSLSVEQSEEALRIINNRYQQGLEKSSDLLVAETQYLKKQLEYLQTVYNYNVKKYELQFLSK